MKYFDKFLEEVKKVNPYKQPFKLDYTFDYDHSAVCQVDIYFPESNLAIEYNGSYYHQTFICGDTHQKNNSKDRSPDYHESKYFYLKSKGITLLNVYDLAYNQNPNAILNNIGNHLSPYSYSIDAIAPIPFSLGKKLIRENFPSSFYELSLSHSDYAVALNNKSILAVIMYKADTIQLIVPLYKITSYIPIYQWFISTHHHFYLHSYNDFQTLLNRYPIDIIPYSYYTDSSLNHLTHQQINNSPYLHRNHSTYPDEDVFAHNNGYFKVYTSSVSVYEYNLEDFLF